MRMPGARTRRRTGIVCLFACLAMYGYWGVWLPLHASGYDFTGPYEAAYALAHHAPLQVYNVPMQRAYNDAVLHLPDGPSDFRWTPPTAAALIPLALLPYSTARVIWWLLGQVALIASLWLLARCAAAVVVPDSRGSAEHMPYAPTPRQRSTLTTFLALFCAAAVAQPVTDSLRLGQSTTFLLLGFALVAYGEVFDRPWLGGIGLGIAILDKLFPGALVLFLLWRGRYRLCVAAVGFVALLVVVTLPVTGFDIYGAFIQALRTYSDQPNAGPVNLSLYHALIVGPAALLRPGQPEPMSGALPLAATLLCVALFGITLRAQGWPDVMMRVRWMRAGGDTRAAAATGTTATSTTATARTGKMPARRESRENNSNSNSGNTRRERLFAVSWVICALLALEPVDWIFYYVLLLVPLAWLLTRPDRVTGGRQRPGALWWLATGLLAYFVATLPLPLDSRTAAPMSVVFVVGICLRPAALLVLWMVHAAFAYTLRAAPAGASGPAAERIVQTPETVG